MAEVLSSPPDKTAATAAPRSDLERNKPTLPPVTIPSATANSRSGHLSLDVFSPVNENGSFEFDRVLKHGDVQIRSRKTKQWKRYFLVLRPNLLSMYKNASEEKLLKQIDLSELTAVARLGDPKGKRAHAFGLYSPSKNYHIQAKSERDADEWIDLIRGEARVDEDEGDSLVSMSVPVDGPAETEADVWSPSGHHHFDSDRLWSSSPEPPDMVTTTTTAKGGIRIPQLRKGSAQTQDLDFTGAEGASYSDFSDGGMAPPQAGSSLPKQSLVMRTATQDNQAAVAANASTSGAHRPSVGGLADAQLDGAAAEIDGERVLWHGYLLRLHTHGGMRQWKRLWAVLRPKSLTFYKNEEEYTAYRLVPISNIISADEIDPVSRSKVHCLQIIAEEKNHKFCAADEESLTRFLGALKSLLAKRRDKDAAVRRGP